MPLRTPVWLRAFDYTGEHRYSFTICTDQRRPVLTTAAVIDPILSHILHASAAEHIAVGAYCFMPDHVHVMAIGSSPLSDARRFVARAKQLSGFHHQRVTGQRLWQRYSWDRVLRIDEQTVDVICYILENPVRAGLARHPLEYPFSGSAIYSRDALMSAFDAR
jgi:putative transposase